MGSMRCAGRFKLILVGVLYGTIMLGALLAQAADIPVDKNGLPLWEIRQYDDFPVRIQLAGRTELDALLAQVPIASFHREQIRLVFDSADGDGRQIAPGSQVAPRVVFEPRVTEQEAAALRAAGYDFERIPDLEQQQRRAMEAAWAEQAAQAEEAAEPSDEGEDGSSVQDEEPSKYGKRDTYHTHAQVGAVLAQTEADHPTLARDFVWGSSVLGRELWGIVISDNVTTEEAEPEVRLSSTMHGNEPPDMEMLLYLVAHLTDNYGQPGFEDVTYLVDNYEIHILPLHNPDGYVAGTRYNDNGIDLNRNFPVPDGTIGDDGTWTEEVETIAFKDYGLGHDFVISQNGHSGALVVNYPWDYTYELTPDDEAIVQLSLEYSTYNLPMYNGSFPQGIIRGALWYVTRGNLQDWSYAQTGCIDETIEISNTHYPPASVLPGLWEDNRESLMHWIKAARYGINGIVTAADSGLPLLAYVTVTGNAKPVHTDPDFGDYYKLLDTGTYELTFEAVGYVSQTISGVSTTWGTPTVLDVALEPLPQGVIAGVVQDEGGTGLDADIEVRTVPGDAYVTTVQSDAASDGVYTVSLYYGDYRLIATSPGYLSDEAMATAGTTPVTVNFTLGTTEVTNLFFDDFESGTGQWLGEWGLADPAEGHDSANSLTDSPDGDYANYTDSSCIMANEVSLNNALEGTLSFWAKWEIENAWDCCRLEISTDGGVSWTALATQYTAVASGQGVQVPVGEPVFDGSQYTWVQNSVDLAPWLGETDVRFRFRLSSDSSTRRDGFYFDDFQIMVTRQVTSAVGPTPDLLVRGLTAYPNPFNPQTTLSFELTRSGPVQLAIFDLQGRLVRRILQAVLTVGRHEATWDGRDARGAAAPSGVYFGRVEFAGSTTQTVKVMLVK